MLHFSGNDAFDITYLEYQTCLWFEVSGLAPEAQKETSKGLGGAVK